MALVATMKIFLLGKARKKLLVKHKIKTRLNDYLTIVNDFFVR